MHVLCVSVVVIAGCLRAHCVCARGPFWPPSTPAAATSVVAATTTTTTTTKKTHRPQRRRHQEDGARALEGGELARQLQGAQLDERVLLRPHALAARAVVVGARLAVQRREDGVALVLDDAALGVGVLFNAWLCDVLRMVVVVVTA